MDFESDQSRCASCGLWRGIDGQPKPSICQPGVGSRDATIILVGEAPGEEEERIGQPFVGRAGQQLNHAIALAGLVRSGLWITNTCRCRPHHHVTNRNRRPTASEVEHCRAYLERELLALPHRRVIVCLGEIAAQAVLGQRVGGVLESRGRVLWSAAYRCWVLLTLHPAYILRAPAQAVLLVQDLRRAQEVAVRGVTPAPPVTIQVVRTLDEAMAARDDILRHAERLHVDWEATGLHLTQSRGFCLGLAYRPHHAYVIPRYGQHLSPFWGRALRVVDEEVIKPILFSGIPKGGWNVAYDVAITHTEYGAEPGPIVWDGMLAHYCLHNHLGTRAHGLKVCADLYTPFGRYDDPLDEWLTAHGFVRSGRADRESIWRAPDDIVWTYNGMDALVSLALEDVLRPRLEADPALWRLYCEERLPIALEQGRADRAGVRIDTAYLDTLSASLGAAIEATEAAITQLVGRPLNPASPQQVGRYLFEERGLPVLATTETGQPSTSEDALVQIEEQDPVIPLILRHRALSKVKGTYVDGHRGAEHDRRALRAALDEDGRARMHTLTHGTETYRFVTRQPFAIHTFPKNQPGLPSVRALVVPDPGYLLAEADFAQQEAVILAILSGQVDLIEALLVRGEDIHERVMQDLFGRSKAQYQADGSWRSPEAEAEYKQWRSLAKGVSFMIAYRGGPRKLAYMLGCRHVRGHPDCQHVEAAQAYIQAYYQRYPQIQWWQEARIEEARRTGRVRTPFGSYRVLLADDPDPVVRMEAERQAVNSPIQMTGSHVMARSYLRVARRFQREQYPGRVLFSVHDELNVQVREDLVREGVAMILEEMTRPFEELDGYAFRVGIRVSRAWGGEAVDLSRPRRQPVLRIIGYDGA